MEISKSYKDLTEKILIDDILINILKYDTILNLAQHSIISKQFNEIINSESNSLYECIKIPRELQGCELSTYKWMLNKLTKNKIKKLDIIDCVDLDIGISILKQIKCSDLETLLIPLAIFAYIDNISDYTSLKRINVRNSHHFSCGVEQTLAMAENILKLRSLTHLSLGNMKYSNGSFISGISTPGLVEIDLTESVNFNIEDIDDFLIKNSSTLKVLGIDGETSSEKVLINCLNKLKLSELSISNNNIISK